MQRAATVNNLNTMMRDARELVQNHFLVLELGSGTWIPGVHIALKAVDQVCRHTWRLSMDGQQVDVELEDKVWAGYHVAPETCHPPQFPTVGTTVRVQSSGGSLQATR